MKVKSLLKAASGVWLMSEMGANFYSDLLIQIFQGKIDINSGLFNDGQPPYRVNSSGVATGSGNVLVIPVTGPMMKEDYCGSLGTASLAKLINDANGTSAIDAIVAKWDTPGGSVDGTEHFANTIRNSKKPVVSFVEQAASAGYWGASGSKEVVLSGHTASVGSIGTMAKLKDVSGRALANGEKEVVMFASRSIHKNRSYIQALEGQPEAFVAEYLDPLNAVFESAVESGRKGKIDIKNEDVLTGKMYFGNNAIKVGLADKIGTLEYAIKRSLQIAKTL